MYRCCGWVNKLATKDILKRILPHGRLIDYKMTPVVNTGKTWYQRYQLTLESVPHYAMAGNYEPSFLQCLSK